METDETSEDQAIKAFFGRTDPRGGRPTKEEAVFRDTLKKLKIVEALDQLGSSKNFKKDPSSPETETSQEPETLTEVVIEIGKGLFRGLLDDWFQAWGKPPKKSR